MSGDPMDGATFPMPSAGEQTAPLTPPWTPPRHAAPPAASYQPAHDPAVHGRAYAVKHQGRDTVTFPAIPGDTPEKCRCGMPDCPDRDRDQDIPMPADTRALLSCGPGVVSKMWRERVRNGQWENVRLFGSNLLADSRKKTAAGAQHIHDDLDCQWHDISAAFRADTPSLEDGDLDADLRWLEAELASQLADLKAMGYRKWLESQPSSLQRAS